LYLSDEVTNEEFLSPRPYSSSPVTVTGRNKKLAHLPVPGNPPLPYDTPPGKPMLPDGTPPSNVDEIHRKRGRTPLHGEPPLPVDTPINWFDVMAGLPGSESDGLPVPSSPNV
jgi:hypothetical protein